jgi:hypothetical protein
MLEETRPDCSYTLLPGWTSWPLACRGSCRLSLRSFQTLDNFTGGPRVIATKQTVNTKCFAHTLLINASTVSLTKHNFYLIAAFKLPSAAKGFKSCEMTMERGCVHACHAGALVHGLEGWDFHEVISYCPRLCYLLLGYASAT